MENIGFLRARESVNYLNAPHPLFRIEASLSPYVGCSMGCVYCPFSFEKKTNVKTDFLFNLDHKLSASSKPLHLGLGASCEPYCEHETEFNVTRNCIELIVSRGFPLQVFTKSPLVLRDADIMKGQSEKGLLAVSVSLIALDQGLTEVFEPSVIPARERIELIGELNKKGIFAGAVLAPIIPYISDSPEQLEAVFEAVKKAGGQYVLPSVLCSGSPAVFDSLKAVILRRFPNILHRIDNLYENAMFPVVTYAGRVNDLLQDLSAKYELPISLPTENDKGIPVDIRQELLR
jgi:DNA repair photolyase